MQKKVTDITQAFESCHFEDALRQIDQLEKKTEAKKKNKLSPNQIIAIQIIKSGSLAAIGKIHQANEIYTKQFINSKSIAPDIAYLFLQISEISMDQRTPRFIEQLEENNKDKPLKINKFILGCRMFAKLARTSLKAYTISKNIQESLKHVYMEYLNVLESKKLIKYSRDPLYQELKGVNLKMVGMFLAKLTQQAKDKILSPKANLGLINLNLKMAINQGKAQEAKILFETHSNILTQPFRYLRSIRELIQEKQTNKIFYVRNMLLIFRKNLDLQKYTPYYDYYDQFLNYLIKQCNFNNKPIDKVDLVILSEQHVYEYHSVPMQQFCSYYCSLYSEYVNLINQSAKISKHDYYKIAIKGLLLQLIKISKITNNQKLIQFLSIYRNEFSKTFTYPKQIKQYADITPQSKPQSFTKDEELLMWDINSRKIFNKNIPKNLQQLSILWNQYVKLYQYNLQVVEKSRTLQKGEKYSSDEFIIILTDIIRAFLQLVPLLPHQHSSISMKIISLLEKTSTKSPFNYDLKLRLLIFYQQMNYHQALIETFNTMDIKSVQYQTLGFFVIRPILQYGLWNQCDDILVRILRSQQQNSRQSAEYAMKALQRLSFDQIEEYLCYEDWQKRSYNRVMLLFCLYMKYKKQGGEFYLGKILQILSGRVTLNCDVKIIRNQVMNDSDYIDLYGIYNNPNILKEQINIRMKEELLIKNKQPFNLGIEITNWKLQDLWNFNQFQIFQRTINYRNGQDLNYEAQIGIHLGIYKNLIRVRISVLNFVNQALKRTEQQLNTNAFSQLKQLFDTFNQKISWRQQIRYITFIRNHLVDSIYLLQFIMDQFKKSKLGSKEYNKEVLKISQNLISQIMRRITEWKGSKKEQIDKQWFNEECGKRDELLERMSIMSVRDIKQTFHTK